MSADVASGSRFPSCRTSVPPACGWSKEEGPGWWGDLRRGGSAWRPLVLGGLALSDWESVSLQTV